jgi:hypothetical protein
MGPPDLLQLSTAAARINDRRLDRRLAHDACHVVHDPRVTATWPRLGGG